jgi:O-antigen/teichoic acid export membrane protein
MATLRATLSTIWHSPTITTFGGIAARSLGLLILLPLVLVRFDAEEISVWYLFAAIASLQLLLDLGFSVTFARVVAYAMGGAGIESLRSPREVGGAGPDWEAVGRIWSALHYVYRRLAAAWFVLLATAGSLAVRGPVALTADSDSAWCAWAVIVVASVAALWGMVYSSFLIGINHVALVRRWDIATSLASTLTGAAVLFLGGDLLALVVAYYAWLVLNVLRNGWLARTVLDGRSRSFPRPRRDPEVLAAVWPSVWRTGIGIVAGYGLIQASGVIYAQVSSAAAAASYFLALRLIQAVGQFSQAPFYSKLPSLARLYAEGRQDEMIRRAQRGMRYAYLIFVIGFILLGTVGGPLLDFVGSNVAFPGPELWSLMGIAFFAERYGAMHLNLYGTTNNVINHIANGGAGIIYIAIGCALFPLLGVYALPSALIAGNVAFYAWYASSRSYQAFGLDPWTFERTAVLPYLAVLALYLVATLLLAS